MGVLPAPIEELLNTALVAELTVVDDRGRPVTHPLKAYSGNMVCKPKKHSDSWHEMFPVCRICTSISLHLP